MASASSPVSAKSEDSERDLRFPLLLACFFLSGFAALLYETVWSRQLSFVFGTSELAVSAVLAAYMGGLALGAMLAARLEHLVRRPVLTYGVLELVIAFGALAVPASIAVARSLYLGWLGDLPTADEGGGWVVPAFQLASSFLVLAPCTIPMGATLPLLAKHAVADDEELGPRIGSLYAINTAGAIGGTLCAAFFLIPMLGLRSTVWVGAALNGLVFLGAALLARQIAARPDDATLPRSASSRIAFHWILPLMTISGAVSFAYEVLWFRLLGWVLGGSIAAFATMLASFLIGIFLGSAVASRWATSQRVAMLGLAIAQIVTGLAAWMAFLSAESVSALADSLGATPANLAPGAFVSVLVLVPMTLSIGATFPFAVRIFAREADDASQASARVYGWNTVGSIIGSIAAGFVLLPALGYEGTLVLGVCTNFALAAWLAFACRESARARWPLAIAALLGLLAILAVRPGPPIELISSSPLSVGKVGGTMRALLVGRSATVTLFDELTHVKMYTNGLPESGAPILPPVPQRRLARMLSKLPVIMHPEAENALVIGLGAGITLAAVPPSIKRIEVIELESEVIAANRLIPDRIGGQPIDDPRVTVRVGDARGHLMLAHNRYDTIISQPSHPWTAGASHLYTREFFRLLSERLEEDGVFAQWIGMRFVNAETLSRLIATMTAAFEHVQVFQPTSSGIVFLGRNVSFDDAAIARALALTPASYADDALHRVEDVLAVRRLDDRGARALTADVAPITDDDNPFAATRQPTHRPGWLAGLLNDREALASDPRVIGNPAGIDLSRLARQIVSHGSPGRAGALAKRLPAPASDIVAGWAALDNGMRPSAVAAFERARATGLRDDGLLAGLVLSGAVAPDAQPLPPELATLVAATAADRARDWTRLAALDEALARIGPEHLLFLDAAGLRLRWREFDDSRETAATRLELTGELYRERIVATVLIQRAEAALVAGDVPAAVVALKDFAALQRTAGDASLRNRLRRALSKIPPEPYGNELKAVVSGRRPASDDL